MKEEHIAYILIALSCIMTITNIVGWTDISWWIVLAPVLSPFLLVIFLSIMLVGFITIGFLISVTSNITRKIKTKVCKKVS